MRLSERSLAGAKCLKYSCLSDSVVVVAQEILKVFRTCGGGRVTALPFDLPPKNNRTNNDLRT